MVDGSSGGGVCCRERRARALVYGDTMYKNIIIVYNGRAYYDVLLMLRVRGRGGTFVVHPLTAVKLGRYRQRVIVVFTETPFVPFFFFLFFFTCLFQAYFIILY